MKEINMVLLISYDLNGHESPGAYAAVEAVIKRRCPGNASNKPLYSQWLVDTSLSPQTWRDELKAAADSNDNIFVTGVTSNYAAYLPQSSIDWLKVHM